MNKQGMRGDVVGCPESSVVGTTKPTERIHMKRDAPGIGGSNVP